MGKECYDSQRIMQMQGERMNQYDQYHEAAKKELLRIAFKNAGLKR